MKPNLTILIADNDRDEALFLNEALSKVIGSYNPVYANSAGECKQLLQTSIAPGLIFLDVNMPIRSGYECLKFIRDNHTLHHVPVVIYSTPRYNKDVDYCYTLGANYYMVKPVTLTELTNMLHHLFVALSNPKVITDKDEFVIVRKPEVVAKTAYITV